MTLRRIDEQLVNIQVQLAKLKVLVLDLSSARLSEGDDALTETVRRHRHDMVEESKALSERIERLCRSLR